MFRSRSPSPADSSRRPTRASAVLALAVAAIAFLMPARAAPPVLTPDEVRTAPSQFVVLAVANPLSARPSAVGGTAHGYGDSGYRVGPTAASVIRDIARQHSLTRVSEWPIEALGMYCVLFRIPPGATREAVIEKLRADKRVRLVQPLNEFESATDMAPAFDDPYAKLQANVLALDMAEAHAISRGTGVRVAVIDTGVDTRHPDLAGRTQLTRNYIDNDEAAFNADRHGTQVAGLIAAVANNGIGIVGVAPDVRLLLFKACWQVSASQSGRCNSFTIAQALADAIGARAQIINLSLVGPSDPLLEALIDKATGAGIVVVGAASADPRLGFPAKLPRVLPVTEAENRIIDVALLRAPARDIVTLAPDGRYDFASGSSLAAAQVSGVVALLLARNQRLGIARLRDLLSQSSRQHVERGGFSSVNACAALAEIVRGTRCRL